MKDYILSELKKVCNIYGLNFSIAKKQINNESRFKTDLTSPAGAVGLAQFMPRTYEYVYNEMTQKGLVQKYNIQDDIWNVDTQLQLYGYYMGVVIPRELRGHGFADTNENRLRGYNAGSSRVEKSKSITETNNYIKDILGNTSSVVGVGILSILSIGALLIWK